MNEEALDSCLPPLEDDPGPMLRESVLFLAQFFGTPVQAEPLQAALDARAGQSLQQTLDALLPLAGLVATHLPPDAARRPTEMPALVRGANGRVLVVLSLKDGRCECHVPGIEGVIWLETTLLGHELGGGVHWLAIRPQLHFDQRSLLYTLPETTRWFWDTFNRHRWMFRWALVGALALNVFGALLPFYAMSVYDRVIPNNAMGSLGVLTTAALGLIGFEFVMKLLRSHLLELAARRMDVALSAQVFTQCLRMRAANRPASGGVLANTVKDFESVRDFFASTTLTLLGDLPFVFLYLAVIALVSGWLVLVPLLLMPVLLGIAWWTRRRLAKLVEASMQASSQRTAHLFETMNGLDTVKALGAEAWSRRKWEGLTQAIAQNSLETREVSARQNYLQAAVLAVANIAVVAVGAWLAADGALTLGQIIAASMLTGRALGPMVQVAGLIVRWQQTRMSFEALDKVMNAPTDSASASLQAPPLKGAVEFREVRFGYPQLPPVLDAFSLRIRPGEKVGVIGKLGSGKSTLLRLILNQYAPDAGSVLVDDLATTQLEPLSLRRQIGYVPQDVTLFHGTLRENIELGRVMLTDEPLLQAIRTACLDDIVQQLPGGVGTQVGERGERLSGGQRQAVAIARALLAQPRLLLLDEPSSMMDPATEQRLIKNLRSLEESTVLLVTHRMAMLALVDRLIVMDRGRIVADGPRDAVLKALSQPPAEPATAPRQGAQGE
ncbi:type I secretion system permease/ATPase [Ideonella livida]|uniref:Cyclolysin secretion/processing ATP-binding protein CyaB n=1 Tax=Ideonella livida TaxID=2707176 RepID=A0A7C9PK39_9BURK|nr:type I secretion system permease/ATPase [Ideonella livida]NDY94016.1 type I secretion system permease/ATPase [Ideonella livida]